MAKFPQAFDEKAFLTVAVFPLTQFDEVFDLFVLTALDVSFFHTRDMVGRTWNFEYSSKIHAGCNFGYNRVEPVSAKCIVALFIF